MEKHEEDVRPHQGQQTEVGEGNTERGSGSVPPAPYNDARASLWLELAAIVGVFLVANLIGGFVGALLVKDASPGFVTFISYVIAFSLTIIFAMWLYGRSVVGRPRLSFSLGRSNPTLILLGVVLVVVISVVIEPLLDMFPTEFLNQMGDAIGTGGWAILTTVVAAPILEETLFRGIIQNSLTKRLGAWKGVLLAAAVFGVVHIIPQQVINAFFIGIVLGYIYIKTRSLVPVIIIHAVNNAIAFVTMEVFGAEAMVSTRDVIGNETAYWIIYGVSCLIFIVAGLNLWSQLNAAQAAEEGRVKKK